MDPITVTTPPYTAADLIAEAARQHTKLTTAPDLMGGVGEQMQGIELWDSLGDDDFDTARRGVDDLLTGAADVSDWAVRLGEAGLAPQTPMAWYGTTTGWELAVQVAVHPELEDAVREELLREIRTAVDTTVKRVLKGKDA